MTNFEYMEQHGQMTIYDFLADQESDNDLLADLKPYKLIKLLKRRKRYGIAYEGILCGGKKGVKP